MAVSGFYFKGEFMKDKRKLKVKSIRDEIFCKIELSAPWIMSPLQDRSIKKLKMAVDKILENNLDKYKLKTRQYISY